MSLLSGSPSLKIGFDANIIQQRVFAKCVKPGKCSPDKLCDMCRITNIYLSFSLNLPLEFEFIIPPKIFRDFAPNYGMRPASTMHIFAILYTAWHFANEMCTPEHPFGSNKKWNRAVLGQRQFAADKWKVNDKSFKLKLSKLLCSNPTTLSLIQLFEERLFEALAIFDVATGEIRDDQGKNQWYKEAVERGNVDANWLDGQAWYIDYFGTRRIIAWDADMEVCRADNLVARIEQMKLWDAKRKERHAENVEEYKKQAQQMEMEGKSKSTKRRMKKRLQKQLQEGVTMSKEDEEGLETLEEEDEKEVVEEDDVAASIIGDALKKAEEGFPEETQKTVARLETRESFNDVVDKYEDESRPRSGAISRTESSTESPPSEGVNEVIQVLETITISEPPVTVFKGNK